MLVQKRIKRKAFLRKILEEVFFRGLETSDFYGLFDKFPHSVPQKCPKSLGSTLKIDIISKYTLLAN